jgi:hypothetical protein
VQNQVEEAVEQDALKSKRDKISTRKHKRGTKSTPKGILRDIRREQIKDKIYIIFNLLV